MHIQRINNINMNFAGKKETAKKDKKPTGTFKAFCTYMGVGGAGVVASKGFNNFFNKFHSNISEPVAKDIHNKLQQAIIDEGLGKKVALELVPEQDFSHLGKFIQKILERTNLNMAIASGKTAACYYFPDGACLIRLPEKKLALTGFHELGHAKTYQNITGKCISKLSKSQFLPAIAGFGLLTALFTRRRVPQDDKPLSKKDKFINFTKNNVAPFAFIISLPTLISEASASIKGHNIAKNYLTTDLLKKYDKSLTAAFGGYAAYGLAVPLGIHLALKVKDHLAGTIPVKNNK